MVNFKKVYECLDDSCKFVIDSELKDSTKRDSMEMPLTRKKFEFKDIKTIGKDEVEGYISTRDQDWSGDIVVPEGLIIEVFNRNPVVLFQHNDNQVVGRCESLVIDEYGVKAIVKFATTDFALDVQKLAKGGFLNCFSIGFIPLDFVRKGEIGFETLSATLRTKYPEYTGDAQRIIKKWVLMEFSFVSQPDNSHAVITSKSLKKLNITENTLKDLNLKCDDCNEANEEFKEIIKKEKELVITILKTPEDKEREQKALENLKKKASEKKALELKALELKRKKEEKLLKKLDEKQAELKNLGETYAKRGMLLRF